MKNTRRFIKTGWENSKPCGTILRLTGFVLVAVMLAGCGPGDQDAMAPTGLPVVAEKKDEMSIPMAQQPASLNPLEAESRDMRFLFSLIFEGLVRSDENGMAEPALAENWSSDEKGRAWEFHIRKEVFFHNGSKLTADDVVYTLDQIKSYASGESPYSEMIKDISFYEATDDYTLHVETSKPGGWLPYAMMFPVMSRSYYGQNPGKTNKKPVGTGPYAVAQYDRGKGMRLENNAKWWKKQPDIKIINAKCAPDNESALGAYDMGDLDMVYTTDITASKYREAGRTKITEVPTMNYEYLIPNTGLRGLADIRMRQALEMALDRPAIIQRAYINHAVVTDVPVAPCSFVYDGKYKVYEYEPVRAVQLLAEIGWQDRNDDKMLEDSKGNELRFKLLVNENIDDPARKEAARAIKEQLEEIGIGIDIQEKPWNSYVSALQNGQFELALAGTYIGGNFDVSYMLRSGSASNYSGYSSIFTNNALLECSAAVDTEAQIKAFSELQRVFTEELPHLPLYFRTNSIVHTEKLQNLEGARDMDIFKRIERWVMYKTLPEQPSLTEK